MKIYILTGYTGKHDDYNEWTVCAFTDVNQANRRLAELTSLMKKLGIAKTASASYEDKHAFIQKMRTHDKGDLYFQHDSHSNTGYTITETDLVDNYS